MKLGGLQAEFAFGVLLVSDEDSTEQIPSWASPDEQVTATGSAAVVRVQHPDEGPVVLRVWDSDESVMGACAFDSRLEVSSGIVKVSDAMGTVWLAFAVPPGACRLQVFVNSSVEADELDLVLGP